MTNTAARALPTYDQRLDDLAAAVALLAGTDEPVALAAYAEAMDYYDWQDAANQFALPGTAILYNAVVKRLRQQGAVAELGGLRGVVSGQAAAAIARHAAAAAR